MSEEKLYAVKNNEGKWADAGYSFGTCAWASPDKDEREKVAKRSSSHVVALVEEPKKVVLPQKAAEWVANAKSSGHDITDLFDDVTMPDEVSDWLYDDDNEAEHREERGLMLANAYQYGYTIEKEKKYNVKVPHTKEVWYYKSGDTDLLTICPADKELHVKFTESEIEHYGLQDCEKVWCDSDD